MIGITPAAFSFKGIYWRAPKIFFSTAALPPSAVLRAYCTGICRTALIRNIQSNIITNQRITSMRISIKPPFEAVNREATSEANACGKRAMIPTIMSSDIPLPIPLSVIFSPNHIAKIVPVTNMVTAGMIKLRPLPSKNAESGTPKRLIPYK